MTAARQLFLLKKKEKEKEKKESPVPGGAILLLLETLSCQIRLPRPADTPILFPS